MDAEEIRKLMLANPDEYGQRELDNLDKLAKIQADGGEIHLIEGRKGFITYSQGGEIFELPRG